MRLLPLLLTGALLATAIGCESRKNVIDHQREINLPRTTTVRAKAAPVSLTMSLSDTVIDYKGEELLVTLELRNHDDAPINLTYTSGKEFDVLVRDPRGKPLMRWSDNRAFTQMMHETIVQPGEVIRRELSLTFPPRLDPGDEGTYTVVGMTTGGVPMTTDPLVVRYNAEQAPPAATPVPVGQ